MFALSHKLKVSNSPFNPVKTLVCLEMAALVKGLGSLF